MTYAKAEKVSIKNDPLLGEKWVQSVIAQDPELLGLGDLILKDAERTQPHGGRLDLLFQDAESTQRYEVEVQLGRTDESHIIRTIEYWDIERKRYPQYEHTAVIVAEDITSRFLNVISLFNGAIPLVAIQMNAIRVGNLTSLVFTKVLDQMPLGLVDEDEEVAEVTDRAYWEARSPSHMMSAADRIIRWLQDVDPGLEPKYNKFYIGFARGGTPNNYVIIQPIKSHVRLTVRLGRSEELEAAFDESAIDLMPYDERSGRYRMRLKPEEVDKHEALLKMVFSRAKDDAGA